MLSIFVVFYAYSFWFEYVINGRFIIVDVWFVYRFGIIMEGFVE